MSRRSAERRTQHAVMATASEWARIRELAAHVDMDLSRYIVHRATVADPLPDPPKEVQERTLTQRRARSHGGGIGM